MQLGVVNSVGSGLRRPRGAALALAVGGLLVLLAGCPMDGTGNDGPKTVQVRFSTFDIGTDDCEDIFSFGDFRAVMGVIVQPDGARRVSSRTRTAELGSAAFQATVQSIDFDELVEITLEPGEDFEVVISITEDDPIASDEPQPWDDSERFDYETVTSRSLTFSNGPGCFRDDRIEVSITVSNP